MYAIQTAVLILGLCLNSQLFAIPDYQYIIDSEVIDRLIEITKNWHTLSFEFSIKAAQIATECHGCMLQFEQALVSLTSHQQGAIAKILNSKNISEALNDIGIYCQNNCSETGADVITFTNTISNLYASLSTESNECDQNNSKLLSEFDDVLKRASGTCQDFIKNKFELIRSDVFKQNTSNFSFENLDKEILAIKNMHDALLTMKKERVSLSIKI